MNVVNNYNFSIDEQDHKRIKQSVSEAISENIKDFYINMIESVEIGYKRYNSAQELEADGLTDVAEIVKNTHYFETEKGNTEHLTLQNICITIHTAAGRELRYDSLRLNHNKPLDLKKLQRDMDKFLNSQIINASKLIMLDKDSLYENLVELTGIKDVTMYIKAENNDTAIDGYVLLKDNRGCNLYLIWTGEVWDVKKARKELIDLYNITYTQSMPISMVKELMYEYRYRLDRKDIYSMRSQVLTDKDRSKLIEDDIYKQIGEI